MLVAGSQSQLVHLLRAGRLTFDLSEMGEWGVKSFLYADNALSVHLPIGGVGVHDQLFAKVNGPKL